METIDLYHLGRDALVLVLVLSLPVFGAALLSGILTGLLSSYTNLSEPAVGLVARLAAVFLVLLAVVPWLGDSVVTFARETWSVIQTVGSRS